MSDDDKPQEPDHSLFDFSAVDERRKEKAAVGDFNKVEVPRPSPSPEPPIPQLQTPAPMNRKARKAAAARAAAAEAAQLAHYPVVPEKKKRWPAVLGLGCAFVFVIAILALGLGYKLWGELDLRFEPTRKFDDKETQIIKSQQNIPDCFQPGEKMFFSYKVRDGSVAIVDSLELVPKGKRRGAKCLPAD